MSPVTDILPELGYAGSKEPALERPPSWETQRPSSRSNQAGQETVGGACGGVGG